MKYIVNTRRMNKVYMDDESGSGRKRFTDVALEGDGLIVDIEDTDESHVFVVYEKSENYMSMQVFYDVKSVIDFINSHDEIVAHVSLFYTCGDVPRAKFVIKKNGVGTESEVMLDTEYDDELEVIEELHNAFARNAGEIKGYVVGYVDSTTGKKSERLYKTRDKAKVNSKAYKYEVKDKNGVIAVVNSMCDYHYYAEDLNEYDIREYEYTVWRTFYTVIDDTYDDVLTALTKNMDERLE